MKINENIARIVPDPIRYWVKVAKDAGAVNMFTIGVPDPMPEKTLETFAKGVYEQEKKGATGYPPFVGEGFLKENIITMESNYGAKLNDTDLEKMYVTVGASQALQFIFSVFKTGSEIIVNTPGWGTIHNLISHSGNIGVPASMFEGGRFIEENAENALSDKTCAVYINYPANPTGEVVPESELKKMCGWAVSNNLQIISDEPYKYILFDRKKTPYTSPVCFGDDINQKVNLISSFSKIVKPDIRLGFIRVSDDILESHEMVGFYFRNLSAGSSRGIQAGVSALIQEDPELKFLSTVIEGYKQKSEIVQKTMTDWGCEFPYKPAGTYMVFPTTPDGSDGEEFVRKMAKEKKTGFVPGSSFGGSFQGFEDLSKHFRMGFGAGMTKERIIEVLADLTA